MLTSRGRIDLIMLETPHVFIGAAIATKIPNPLIAIPLAFASHFVLEMIPHWNPHLNTEVKLYGRPTGKSTLITAVDSTIALVSGSIIAFQNFPDKSKVILVLASCFFAVLPDLLEAPYFFLHIKSKFTQKWIAIQKRIQNDTSVIPGLITQILILIGVIFWI